jgi:NADH:ubiquinone reductase (H+-translocating)
MTISASKNVSESLIRCQMSSNERTSAKVLPEANESSVTVPHVVVIGGGFAGLACVRALATTAVRITLIDRSNHHLFQPLLYQVATAGLSAPDIAAPLRHILRRQANVQVRLGNVTAIDTIKQTVETEEGALLRYDYLVVAAGATHAYFGRDEWAAHAPGLKTLDDAMTIRRRILLAFEQAEKADTESERAAWMHFAIVGGGPTGVELAGTLAEIARHTLKSEFRAIDPSKARVRLIEGGPRLLASFPESLSNSARKQLERLGVEVSTGRAVSSIHADGYALGDENAAAKTVIWAAGVAASPLGRMLAAETDRAGRVIVSGDLSLPDARNVFIAGDLASVVQSDKPVPGVAPAAKQMGACVAAAIRARLAGLPAKGFTYRDFGNLATIGRLAAVVDLRGVKFSGMFAWWFWLLAHVFFLIGFRNRLVVLLNWAWSYWSYQRAARTIFGCATAKQRE